MTRRYRMTKSILANIKRTQGLTEVICNSPLCDEAITVDDWVWSTGSDNHVKIWHENCYDETFIEVE